jgi:homoserine kinase
LNYKKKQYRREAMDNPGCNSAAPFRMFFPATSANLGPAFDVAALAFDFGLRIEASPASEFSLVSRGCNADVCGRLESNLTVETYRIILRREDLPVTPLTLKVDNEIPLGMGCGSSAAAVLAGVALAAAFGGLDWNSERIVSEATAFEGHPDNVAACWYGGVIMARTVGNVREGAIPIVQSLPIPIAVPWPLMLAIPDDPLPTSEARRVLPRLYSRVDLVHNVQSAMMLVMALTQGRGEWLREALSDRVHHPYRAQLCPLLPALSELAGGEGILGVALSGAGPAVLLFLDCEAEQELVCSQVEEQLRAKSLKAELRLATISATGAKDTFQLSATAAR